MASNGTEHRDQQAENKRGIPWVQESLLMARWSKHGHEPI